MVAFDGEFDFLYLLSMLMNRQEVTQYGVVSSVLKEDGLCAPNGVAELEDLRVKMPQKAWTVCCQGDLAHRICSQVFRCLAELEETKLWWSGERKGMDSLCNLNSNYLHLCYCELPDGMMLCYFSSAVHPLGNFPEEQWNIFEFAFHPSTLRMPCKQDSLVWQKASLN